MSSRKPYSDATATLGTLHANIEARDAVHLAVYQVELGVAVKPGQPLSIIDGKAYLASEAHAVGIADPFIKEKKIKAGAKIWLILYPGMIQSLRHVWEHDSFKQSKDDLNASVESKDSAQDESYNSAVAYLENIAKQIDLDLSDLLYHAKSYLEHGSYYVGGSECEGFSFDHEEFWNAYEKVTGTKAGPNDRYSFISCSC